MLTRMLLAFLLLAGLIQGQEGQESYIEQGFLSYSCMSQVLTTNEEAIITCSIIPNHEFFIFKGQKAELTHKPKLKASPSAFNVTGKVKHDSQKNETSILIEQGTSTKFNLTTQSQYLMGEYDNITQKHARFSNREITLNWNLEFAQQIKSNHVIQSPYNYIDEYAYFGKVEHTIKTQIEEPILFQEAKDKNNTIYVQFDISTRIELSFSPRIETKPFDLFVIKIESKHYPLLTQSWHSIFPKGTYAASFTPNYKFHNYFAGQKWFGISGKNKMRKERFEQQLCRFNIDKEKKKQLEFLIKEDFQAKFLIKNTPEEQGLPASVNIGHYDFQTEDVFVYTSFIFNVTSKETKNPNEKGAINGVTITPYKPRLLREYLNTDVMIKVSILYGGSSPLSPTEQLVALRKENSVKIGFIEGAISVMLTLAILFVVVVLVNYILIKTVRTDLLKYKKIAEIERSKIAGQDQGIDLGTEEDEGPGAQPDKKKRPPQFAHHKPGGWKIISQDAQQPPDQPFVLVACVGAGIQLLFTFSVLLLIGSIGDFFLERRQGVIVEWLLYLYIFGSIPGGFTSGYLYKKLAPAETRYCVLNLLATTLVVPVPVLAVTASVSIVQKFTFIGFALESTKSLPASQFIELGFFYLIFIIPFTICAGLIGRNMSNNPLVERPRIQRELPKNISCMHQPSNLLAVSGLLQFIPVCIFYVDTLQGIWDDFFFTEYLLMFVELILLLLLVATIGMATVYLILQSENHKWWKPAFSIGGALSTYTFFLSVLFFIGRLLATADDGSTNKYELSLRLLVGYLAYNMLIGWVIYIMMGAVGFLASFGFMRYLYSKVRLD